MTADIGYCDTVGISKNLPFSSFSLSLTDELEGHLQLGQGHQRLLGDPVGPRRHPILVVVRVPDDDLDRLLDQARHLSRRKHRLQKIESITSASKGSTELWLN